MNYQNEQSNQNYHTQGIIGCPSERKGPAATLSLGRKGLIYLRRESKKIPVSFGNFCLALSPPVGSAYISCLLLDFWLKPTYVLFSQQCKSSCFPKAWEVPFDTSCSGQSRAGREPSWLWDFATHPHQQIQSAASLPASQSFHFFSCSHHLNVNQWLKPKRKIKHKERKQKTKKLIYLKNILYARNIT